MRFLPWALPWFLAVPYWLGFVVVWRALVGHVAWAVHRSAKTNPTIRPPVENWIAAAIACAPLAVVWFVVMLFVVRWPKRLTRGAEREAEVEIRDLNFRQLEMRSERMYKEIVAGDVVSDD